MRFVSKKEDSRLDEELFFYKSLVDSLRLEIIQMRAQIDEAREIPPYLFDVTGKKEAKIHVMNDKRMKQQQNGEPIDEDD